MARASQRFIQSVASQSLGRAWNHSIEKKLSACAKYGFRAIEVFMEDLEYVARDLPLGFEAAFPSSTFESSSLWDEQRLAAAGYIHHLCQLFDLTVICIQPFTQYDGLVDREQHAAMICELRLWIQLARRLGTDLIQVPSSFLPDSECSSDRNIIVRDLQEIADIGLQCYPPIRFAYEALCWGTHVDTWDQAWEIIEAVDRPNFGTCLDTFNIAGRVFADPEASSGCTTTAESDMTASLATMRRRLDIAKVFYVEFCDGERLDQPLTSEHPWYVQEQPARMTWSRNARLFPFEAKGYLPALRILETIIDLGYEGYIAFELFSRTANAADDNVPEDHARRGQESWNKMIRHLEAREWKGPTSQTEDTRFRLYDDTTQNMARL